MADRSRTGMARAALGRRGGYRLARPPETISLLEAVEAAEGTSRRRTCVLRGSPCTEIGRCEVHDAFTKAQNALLSALDGTTLRDVVRVAGDRLPAHDSAFTPA
jgi:Rrf2 family protein